MTWDAHKNFASTTVATAPSPATSGTSLVVASGTGSRFPAVPFNAVVWPAGATAPTTATAEVVRVTARSTDTLTITRAQESSSARTIVVGDQIANTATAKVFTDIESEVDAWKPLSVIKSASTGQSGTGLTDDPELFLDLTTGRTYLVDAIIVTPANGGSATPDIKTGWTFSGTSTLLGARSCIGLGTASTDASGSAVMRMSAHGLGTAVTYGVPQTGNTAHIRETFVLQVTAGGRLQFQWAQNVNDAVNLTQVQNLSWITATRTV